jgi:hypothetical protein
MKGLKKSNNLMIQLNLRIIYQNTLKIIYIYIYIYLQTI